jgi:predicted permease
MAIPFHRSLEHDLDTVGRPADFRQKYLRGQITIQDAVKGFDQEQQAFAKPLHILLAMVGTLLLIACVNVANLAVSRATARQKEIAIRLSLGSSRVSLVRMMMTESFLIAAAGGALGLALSYWIADLLIHLMPYDNVDVAIPIAPDVRVLGFTAAVSLTAALLFGMIPALQATRPGLAPTLKSEALSTSMSAKQARLRKLLVSAQVTLSLLLLMGAGLFARSLHKLMSVDSGMKIGNVLSFTTDPSLHKYGPERSARLFLDLQERIKRIPGVRSASAALGQVLANQNWINTVHVEGYQPREGEEMNPGWNAMLPGFFATVGVPLIAGRDFTDRDTAGAPKVMIVNETFAKRFVSQGNPVGLHVGFGDSGPMDMEIVGVVKDMKDLDLTAGPRPCAYSAVLQDQFPELTVYVLASSDPLAIVPAIRSELSQLDASLPMLNVKTIAARIDETHYVERLFAWLSGAFGVLATLLASIGLYGVTAFAVARRGQEIGIRMALGAQRSNVLRLVLREVLLLTAIGVACGIPLALALGRLVENQLFAVKGTDPAVMAAAAAIIATISILAGYLPARRAARIDPVNALRYE